MKTIIALITFFVSTAHAQVVVQTQQLHEVTLNRLTVNPFPPGWRDPRVLPVAPRSRKFVSIPVTEIIPTAPLTRQDQQLIELIK